MRKPVYLVAGIIIALFGFVFFLQGIGVLEGSAMSNTVFWSIAGPVVVIVGVVMIVFGARGRLR
ncbi:hypothetical protein [Williamsia phyllosphaerae]|uniref:Integral membrane protein n=1 Tax=Williamsia phyllosphaerae TaxID=885042 RepID=A0ABQ1UQP6_9NOCA|nr:hypothetical protein [Williamsia phyllosphaerae]GGF23068.1 hypothetical protein GCM10007298_18770 [Williamsia phyllosphaerae]